MWFTFTWISHCFSELDEEKCAILLDKVEGYVIDALGGVTCSNEDEVSDVRIQRWIRQLHWVRAEMLQSEISVENGRCQTEVEQAVTSIIEMNSKATPADKLLCITQCAKWIFEVRYTRWLLLYFYYRYFTNRRFQSWTNPTSVLMTFCQLLSILLFVPILPSSIQTFNLSRDSHCRDVSCPASKHIISHISLVLSLFCFSTYSYLLTIELIIITHTVLRLAVHWGHNCGRS